MLLFLSVFGIIISMILLYFNARNYRSSLYLGLFFLFTSLYGLYHYILLYSKSVMLISIFLFNLSISTTPVYLIGPMLYWYIRSVLSDDPKLKRSDLWHAIPAVIYFISALPNTFVPLHDKVETARAVVQNQGIMVVYKATLLSEILPNVAIYLTRVLLVLGYTVWSMVIFIRYLIKKRESAVFSKQQFMKKWLCCLLGFLLVLAISQVFLIKKSFEMQFSSLFFTLNIIRVISASGLAGLLTSPLLFPVILYGLPRMPALPGSSESSTGQPKTASDKTSQYFEDEYLQNIGHLVNSLMHKNKPYLEHSCNLAGLSKMVNVPAHHLAYYFREVKKQPFNDFRNEWRVNHAKALIEDGKAAEMTLEAIGSLSGFSSRNAFITGFKKSEGISPGMYAARFH